MLNVSFLSLLGFVPPFLFVFAAQVILETNYHDSVAIEVEAVYAPLRLLSYAGFVFHRTMVNHVSTATVELHNPTKYPVAFEFVRKPNARKKRGKPVTF